MIKLFTEEEYLTAKSTYLLSLQCECCGITFKKQKKFVTNAMSHNTTKNQLKYCSKPCQTIKQITKHLVICKQCNVEFYKTAAQVKNHPNHFCGSSCAATYNNTHKTKGYRRSKLEIWMEQELPKLYPTLQFLFNDKTAINSELDIYIPSLKLAFELNGIFHYEPIYGDIKLNQTQLNDSKKFKLCHDAGIGLCVIDVSQFKHFKPFKAQKYLDIISNIISQTLSNINVNT